MILGFIFIYFSYDKIIDPKLFASLINNYDITAEDAYMLCSLVGDLHIAEVVDVPNMLVTMHFPKSVLEQL